MEFSASQSLFSQIKTEVKRRIFSGVYKSGEKIPPIRELAVELKVNPNTIVRAYSELEAEQLIFTESTNGKFVTRDEDILVSKRDAYLKSLANDYFTAAKEFGLNNDYALSIMEEKYASIFSDFARFQIVRETPCAKRRIG